MSSAPTKRFIAGAVCPRCAAQDRVVVFDEGDRQRRECVDCGFTDLLPGADAGALPKGRLDAPRPQAAAPTTKPLQFHPRKRRSED